MKTPELAPGAPASFAAAGGCISAVEVHDRPSQQSASLERGASKAKAEGPIYILSLGAGVQSSTLALMASYGEITPQPAFSVFADTMAEPMSVYRWLDYLEPRLSFPVFRVSRGNLEQDALRVRQRKDGNGSWVPSGVPHYSVNADGTNGHGPRQCTGDFKLEPIVKRQRQAVAHLIPAWRKRHKAALSALSGYQREMRDYKRARKAGTHLPLPKRPAWAWDECQSDPLVVAMIGISLDEASRMKPSLQPWIRNEYPLVERRITRRDCLSWMEAKGFPRPPRSACVFCPYHSDKEWQRLKDEEPSEFERAVVFERAYQAAKAQTVSKKHFKPFLHASRKNLDEVTFDPMNGQPELFENDCQGMCGV